MSRLLCCLRARRTDMGAALSHPQEGEACDGAGLPAAPPTMADVIRERKKKAGGAALGTLRRRIANAARRPRDNRPDRGCEHARFIRSVVSPWRLVDVFLLSEELEAGAALRDLCTQAELAREPAPALHIALQLMYTERWWCDIEIVGAGWSLCAHRCILWARSGYFRALLANRPQSCNRVPLEGACSSLTREEVDAALLSMYSGGNTSRRHCRHHNSYDSNEHTDGDLDLVDNTGTCRSNSGSSCACTVRRGAARRAAQLLAVTRDPLATSMRYLLDSGEMSDAKLVFRTEGSCGAQYGFRSALELPCHRVLLGARSRFFRSVMSRRNSGGTGGAVCVDEKVLPRRFARALLHAAYTDQVDLSLINRNPTLAAPLPATTSAAGWSASRAGVSRLTTPTALEDVFQLYEIARFLEMSIVIQGCEDAISSALTPDTLPLVLRWSAHHHASQWVHRQAMRYLRDEFVTILSNAASANISQSALATSLASPFLQASEMAALRAVLKYAHLHKHKQREPNVVWVGASSVSRRRRELSDAALRDILAPLVRHIRTEHIPPDNELLQQLVRRGIVPAPPAPPAGEEGSSAHAWLGRGSYRPARCFLPYLDEIKALLEDQPVPDAELARARRARYMHRIPDTLYMVAAGRTSPPSPPPAAPGSIVTARACVCTRTMHALRTRCRELRAARARPATSLHHHQEQVNRQIALRAVREMSLPDTCAELLITDMDDTEAESVSGACETPRAERRVPPAQQPQDNAWQADCCSREGGSLRCNSSGSLRALELGNDNSRTGSCTRREQSTRSETSHHSRSLSGSCGRESARGLSARVPDVAMAPNANTHLLTAGYCGYPHPHPPAREYGGVVLQLDLGDGATHTPRPGSRAQRNSLAAQQSARTRDHAPVAQAISCLRARPDEDELRAAIELSVMRAYSSFQWRGVGAGGEEGPARGGGRGASLPLPPAPGPLPAFRPDLPSAPDHNVLLAGSSPRGRTTRATRAEPSPPHLAIPHASPSPSPRRRDYRLEGGAYGGSSASSRGHSPNNYA